MDLVNDRVSGKSGCNRFTGMMQKSDQPYRIGAIAGTKMACLEEKMKMEDLFLGMLQKVTGYSFRSGNLIMDVEDGRQLVFRAD
jgi:heat shock protein HslJ